MSELQRQLQSLKNQTTLETSIYDGTPSLFLSKKEAGNIDIDSVFDAAVNGITVLKQYEPKFSVFIEHILHPSSVSVQRELLTPEEERVLNHRIEDLLELLSLYAGDLNAHKVLEYLIRRYRIHELNADALLRCMISQHDTKIFARVVQLSKIASSVWAFLEGIKTSGTTLPRSFLSRRCHKDNMLLSKLTSVAQNALRVVSQVVEGGHVQKPCASSLRGVDAILSFYTATVLEMIEETRSVTDSQLRTLCPFIVNGITCTVTMAGSQQHTERRVPSAAARSWLHVSCMLVSQIARYAQLGKGLLKSICSAMANGISRCISKSNASSDLGVDDILLALIVLAQHQKVYLTDEMIMCMFTDDNAELCLDVLIALEHMESSAGADASPLFSAIMNGVVAGMTSEYKSERSTTDVFVSGMDKSVLGELFCRIASSVAIQEKVVSNATEKLLQAYASCADTIDEGLSDVVAEVMRVVSQRYPVSFDLLIKKCTQKFDTGNEEHNLKLCALKNIISVAFSSTAPYRVPVDSGAGLFLSLSHSSEEVRVEALRMFAGTVSEAACGSPTSDLTGLAGAVLRTVEDSEVNVVCAACQPDVLSRVIQLVDLSEFTEVISSAVSLWLVKAQQSMKKSVTVLSVMLKGVYSSPVMKHINTKSGEDEWTISVLCTHLLSCLQLCKNINPQSDYACLLVEGVAEAFNNLSSAFVPFRKCVVSVPQSFGCVYDLVVKSVAESIAENAKINCNETLRALSTLHRVIYDMMSCQSDIKFDFEGSVNCLLNTLLVSLDVLSKSSKSMDTLRLFLDATLSWSIMVYEDGVETTNEFKLNLDKTVVGILQLCVKAGICPVNDISNSLLSCYSQSLSRLDLSARVLVSLLDLMSSDCERAAPLVRQCVEAFFPSSPIAVCTKIASSVFSQCVCDDNSAVISTLTLSESATSPLPVSEGARVAALYTLSAYVSNIKASHSIVNIVSCLVPLVVYAASSSGAGVRTAASALVKQLASLSYTKSSKDSPMNGHVLKSLFDSMAVKRQSICYDEKSIVEFFKTVLCEGVQYANELQTGLLGMAADIAWTCPHVTFSLLSVTTSAKFALAWPCLKKILSKSLEHDFTADLAVTTCLARELIEHCVTGVVSAEVKVQSDVRSTFVAIINDHSKNTPAEAVRKSILQSICPDKNTQKLPVWVEKLQLADREELFTSLIGQIDRNVHEDFLTPVSAIPVSASTVLSILEKTLNELKITFKKYSGDTDFSLLNGHANGSMHSSSGLAFPLQRMSWHLEAVMHALKSATSEDSEYLSKSASVLLDMLSALNSPMTNTVLTVAFTRGLIMELACICLTQSRSFIGSNETSKVRKTRKRANSLVGIDVFSASRVDSDVETILSCLQLSSTTYTQTFALRLLDILISISPASAERAVLALSKVLASSAAKENISSDDNSGLTGSILRTITTIRGNSVMCHPQEALEPFFSLFQSLSNSKRSMLMNIALREYDAGIVPTCVCILLAHTFVAHSTADAREGRSNVGDEGTGQDVFILLSRSAQRKANRSIRMSRAEEFFNLATTAVHQAPVSHQIETLVTLTNFTQRLLMQAVSNDIDVSGYYDDENDVSNPDDVVVEMTNTTPYKFMLSRHAQYCNSLLGDELKSYDNSAALMILHLEFILEFVENTHFHNDILSSMSSAQSSRISEDLQRQFLLFCEQLLELLSFATHVQHSLARDTSSVMSVILNGSSINISSSALAKKLWGTCLDIIHGIQRLLDGPTFIVILQELLNHENLTVRQKSLQILADRLRDVSSKGPSADDGLYLDLADRLKESVLVAVPDDCEERMDEDNDVSPAARIGIAQSALLCIDVLAREFVNKREWIVPMTDILVCFTKLVTRVTTMLYSDGCNEQDEELQKLLGSSLLCCGTICGLTKARSLPALASLMNGMLLTIECETRHLRNACFIEMEDESENKSHQTKLRTRVVLVRSSVAAVTSIAVELSAFFHPYIPRALESVLPLLYLNGVPDATFLSRDASQCTTMIASHIPARLCIPAVLQAAPSLYSKGHNIAASFLSFQKELWSSLNRSTVEAHIQSLEALATSGLNYRFMYGDHSAESETVDDEACEACVELCLKMTEVELRAFIIRLLDWCDAENRSDNSDVVAWKSHARSTVFFRFVSSLESKLRSIFVPLMSLVWTPAADYLTKLVDLVQGNSTPQSDVKQNSSKKSKKRKRQEVESGSATEIDRMLLSELKLASEWVLEAVRLCCVHDTVSFIDQFQYEAIMPQMSSVLSLRQAFETDEDYSRYALEAALPAVVQLVIAVGKDILWKPLNHKVLLMTRNSKKSVRIVGLKALQRLFNEVGEEYLLLLPECLPYLSELMEDDATDVTSLASEVIQGIEELSGESLDSYLR